MALGSARRVHGCQRASTGKLIARLEALFAEQRASRAAAQEKARKEQEEAAQALREGSGDGQDGYERSLDHRTGIGYERKHLIGPDYELYQAQQQGKDWRALRASIFEEGELLADDDVEEYPDYEDDTTGFDTDEDAPEGETEGQGDSDIQYYSAPSEYVREHEFTMYMGWTDENVYLEQADDWVYMHWAIYQCKVRNGVPVTRGMGF